MDLLKRELAPILPEAWRLIDAEARRVLALNLAGRKLVDFRGPHGWAFAAVNTGRLDLREEKPAAQVHVGVRVVKPLVELRVPVTLDIMELDGVARGATDPDLDPVVEAAERIALAEDRAIFHGLKAAGIVGLVEASPHASIAVAKPADYPRLVIQAKETLQEAGVDGPYALALGPSAFDQLFAAADDGYPIAKRIAPQILDGPIVRAPALEGGVVLSTRGGDYELTVGQDLSVGYAWRDKHKVELFLTESFTFRVLEPTAAVHLKAK